MYVSKSVLLYCKNAIFGPVIYITLLYHPKNYSTNLPYKYPHKHFNIYLQAWESHNKLSQTLPQNLSQKLPQEL